MLDSELSKSKIAFKYNVQGVRSSVIFYFTVSPQTMKMRFRTAILLTEWET